MNITVYHCSARYMKRKSTAISWLGGHALNEDKAGVLNVERRHTDIDSQNPGKTPVCSGYGPMPGGADTCRRVAGEADGVGQEQGRLPLVGQAWRDCDRLPCLICGR